MNNAVTTATAEAPTGTPVPLALVTGASAGIGEALARELASRGYHLALAARSADALHALAADLRAKHPVQAHVFPTDLADPDAPARLVTQLADADLHVSFLANNAGFGLNDRFWHADLRRSMDMIQLNVAALTELTHRLIPTMARAADGRPARVLNVASIAGFLPGPYQALYFATKAFVLSLSVALNEELRADPSMRGRVTVTALCPGPVKTKFADAAGLTNAKLFQGPAVVSPQAVARAGVNAALASRPIVVPGFFNKLTVWSARLIPRPFAARIVMGMQRPTH